MSEAFPGMMVTPSVRLVRPLGEGGMGAVWVAEHLALRTQVVVKFIASGLKTNKEAQERFSREAAAASQVKSPHVVQTFDHGITEDGIPYIVMELLEGRDLGEYLDLEAKVPADLVVEIVGQLARALDRAHEKGIIHRDIKPGNIYLCDAGPGGEVFVKLLDFGIAKGVELAMSAKGIDSGTKTGSMVGSPFYMSPEQILGSKGIDHRSDLWSVGVLAFEMLTGKKPFDAETMGGLAIKIHSEPLPLPTTVDPELSPAVDAWFAKACARDVSQRFDSAKELAEALARALGGKMPRSLDHAPRLSSGSGARRVSGIAPTLAAGASTDAGVVRGSMPGRARSRLLVLLAIVVVVPPLVYVGLRALRGGDAPTALVSPEPTTARGGASGPQHAEPSGSPTAITSSTPSAPTAISSGASGASGASTAAASPTAAPTAGTPGAGGPAGTPVPRPAGHGARPRPGAVHNAASVPPTPATATSPLPLPPAVPQPAPSGHDIF